jgi:hypothetical protein
MAAKPTVPNIQRGTTDFRSAGVNATPQPKIAWSPPPSGKK